MNNTSAQSSMYAESPHQPLTTPTVMSASPSPPPSPEPYLIAVRHRSHAHVVSRSTSSSLRSFGTCNSKVATRDCEGPSSPAEVMRAFGGDAKYGVNCQMCGAGRCRTCGCRSICDGNAFGQLIGDRGMIALESNLSHGTQERLHAAAREPPRGCCLKQHSTERNGSGIRQNERHDGFDACQKQIEIPVLVSNME